jgi:hydroxylamine reductase
MGLPQLPRIYLLHDSAVWFDNDVEASQSKAKKVGILATANEDVRSLRSLREFLIIGIKGVLTIDFFKTPL